MYFKRIEMHGFKSFAEPVVIEFHEGVTCIVGPNGSGKSNISDALRWVLGEQSPKQLRGNKMDEVIFAGNDEVIELSHHAASKEIFAVGAIKAAKFMAGKTAGLYSMDDLISEFE